MLDARTHFEAVKAGLPGDAARRADMLVQAEQLGLPTRRQESWHYTDLPQLLKRPWPVPTVRRLKICRIFRLSPHLLCSLTMAD